MGLEIFRYSVSKIQDLLVPGIIQYKDVEPEYVISGLSHKEYVFKRETHTERADVGSTVC